jgi:hypothetical protein
MAETVAVCRRCHWPMRRPGVFGRWRCGTEDCPERKGGAVFSSIAELPNDLREQRLQAATPWFQRWRQTMGLSRNGDGTG